MGDLLERPVHRWHRGMDAIRAKSLPNPAGIRRHADDSEATAADAAVVYLESVVSAAFEATAGEIDAELAGRCLLAEDVLYILTGSSDVEEVRAWIEARGLEPFER